MELSKQATKTSLATSFSPLLLVFFKNSVGDATAIKRKVGNNNFLKIEKINIKKIQSENAELVCHLCMP